MAEYLYRKLNNKKKVEVNYIKKLKVVALGTKILLKNT